MNDSQPYSDKHDIFDELIHLAATDLDVHQLRQAVSRYAQSACPIEVKINGLARLITDGPPSVTSCAGILLFRAIISCLGEDAFLLPSTPERERVATSVREVLLPWHTSQADSDPSQRSQYALLNLSIVGFKPVESLIALTQSPEFYIASTAIRSLYALDSAHPTNAIRDLFHRGDLRQSSRFFCAIHLLSKDDLSPVEFLCSTLGTLSGKQGLVTALDLARAGERCGMDYLQERFSDGVDKGDADWCLKYVDSIPEDRWRCSDFRRLLKMQLQRAIALG